MNSLRTSLTRRAILGAAAAATMGKLAHAQEIGTPESTPGMVPIESTTTGDTPSAGGLRPGPLGQDSPLPRAANPTAPVNIVVEKAGINADIESLNIVNGVMENPTGPWVVAWYQETATLGEPGNVVLAGHVDFWNVGPSVFFNVRDLVEGDQVVLTGENGRTYQYSVNWVETFTLEELQGGGKLQEVVGHTDNPSLTMITCGGEFDYVNGEYLSRMVVRASYVAPPPATPEGSPASTPGS